MDAKQKQVSASSGRRVLVSESGGEFLLVKPKNGSDAHGVAKAMASCSGVEKVILSSGEYGFVVSTRRGSDIADVISRLRTLAKSARISTATRHFTYVKRGVRVLRRTRARINRRGNAVT